MFQFKKPSVNWLSVGYQIFGEEGPEGIQVERLSRILQVNKSSFYHFFVNKEMYIEELIRLHRQYGEELEQRVWKLDSFNPGYIQLLIEYRDTILFHRQLLRNSQFPEFKNVYHSINSKIELAILPLWKQEVGLPDATAQALFEIIRDTFFGRMNHKNFTADFVYGVLEEAKGLISQIKQREDIG